MIRIIIICEGETEQAFCNTILYPHFFKKGFIIQPPLIKKTRGGIVHWNTLKKEIENYLKNDTAAFVTSLIDYYGLNENYSFPAWKESLNILDNNKRMEFLEKGMKSNTISRHNHRFIPYLQLHEFEGLLFNNMDVFYQQIPPDDLIGISELQKTFRDFDNLEMINDKKETCPSARLGRIISGYNKIVYGNIIAEAIGLENIRRKSPRFNSWITNLENL